MSTANIVQTICNDPNVIEAYALISKLNKEIDMFTKRVNDLTVQRATAVANLPTTIETSINAIPVVPATK